MHLPAHHRSCALDEGLIHVSLQRPRQVSFFVRCNDVCNHVTFGSWSRMRLAMTGR